jgi:putative tryptophan/tyrosine transport system substrate-binding protein
MLNLLRGLLVVWFCLLTTAEASPRVALVYNAGQDVFKQFAEALTPLLRSQGYTLEHHDSRNWRGAEAATALTGSALIIAAGSDAAALLAQHPSNIPLLCVLLSRQQFEQHTAALQSAGRSISAIYQDPPARRQLQLAQLLLPDLRNIGYLYQPGEEHQIGVLRRITEPLGIKLANQPVASDDELPAALVSVISQSDALLASANSALYNRYTIKTILTAAYRQEKVLIGSSPAFVKAGSLATTYSSVQHVAIQVHEMISTLRLSESFKLPAASYARYFDISINTDVARSLDIRLPDNDALLKALTERARAEEKAGVDHE